MRYVVEYRAGADIWKRVGSGEGVGPTAVADAMRDLMARQSIPSGAYRYRPDDGATDTWGLLTVDAEGRVRLIDAP